jgi:hypothetical protein
MKCQARDPRTHNYIYFSGECRVECSEDAVHFYVTPEDGIFGSLLVPRCEIHKLSDQLYAAAYKQGTREIVTREESEVYEIMAS